MAIWHVSIDGVPACTSPVVLDEERLEPPICGARNRERVQEYADLIRSRHPGCQVEIVAYGCPMRGE